MKHLNADLDLTTNIEVPITPSNRILGLDGDNNIVEIQGSGSVGDDDDDFELGDDMDNTLVGQTYCYTAGEPVSECYVIGASVRISQDNTTSYAEGTVTSLDVTTSTTGGSTNTPDCGGWEEGDAISGTYWEWEVVSQTLGQEPWGPGGVYFDHGIDYDWEFPNGVTQWLLFDVNGGQEGIVDGDSSPVNLFVGQKLYGKFGTYAETYNDGNATPIGGTFTSSRVSSEGTTTLRKVRQITTAPAPQKWISRAYLVGNPLNTSTLAIVEEEAVFPSLRGNTVGNNLGTIRYQGNNYVMQNGFMPAGTGITNLTPVATFDQAHTSTTADDGVYETFAFSQNVPTKKVVCESDGSFNPIGDGTTTSSTEVCVEITNVNADASTNFEFDIVSTNTYTATVICPGDTADGGDGDLDLGDGDLIVDGGEDVGDGTISAKSCSGRVAITNNTASGSIHTLTLLTGIASDFKIGDTVKFYTTTGTEITTVTATLTSKINKGETTLRVQATTGSLSSITAGTLIEICPGTGTIVIDGDGDTDGDVEIDGDGNIDADGDISLDGDLILPDDNEDTDDPMITSKKCTDRVLTTTILSRNDGSTTSTYVFGVATNIPDAWSEGDKVNFYANAAATTVSFVGNLSRDVTADSGILNVIVQTANVISTGLSLEICPNDGTLIVDGDVEIDGDLDVDGDVDLGDGMIMTDGDPSTTTPYCTAIQYRVENRPQIKTWNGGNVDVNIKLYAWTLDDWNKGDDAIFYTAKGGTEIARYKLASGLGRLGDAFVIEASYTEYKKISDHWDDQLPGSPILYLDLCSSTRTVTLTPDPLDDDLTPPDPDDGTGGDPIPDDMDGNNNLDGDTMIDGDVDIDGDADIDGDLDAGDGGICTDFFPPPEAEGCHPFRIRVKEWNSVTDNIEMYAFTGALWNVGDKWEIWNAKTDGTKLYEGTLDTPLALSGLNFDANGATITDSSFINGAAPGTGFWYVQLCTTQASIAMTATPRLLEFVDDPGAVDQAAASSTGLFKALPSGAKPGGIGIGPNSILLEQDTWIDGELTIPTDGITIGTGTTRLRDGLISSTGGFVIDPNATVAPTVPTHGLRINGSLNVQAGTNEDDKDVIFQLNNGNDAKFAVQDLNGQSIFEVNDGPGIIIGNTADNYNTPIRVHGATTIGDENVSRNLTVTGTTRLGITSETATSTGQAIGVNDSGDIVTVTGGGVNYTGDDNFVPLANGMNASSGFDQSPISVSATATNITGDVVISPGGLGISTATTGTTPRNTRVNIDLRTDNAKFEVLDGTTEADAILTAQRLNAGNAVTVGTSTNSADLTVHGTVNGNGSGLTNVIAESVNGQNSTQDLKFWSGNRVAYQALVDASTIQSDTIYNVTDDNSPGTTTFGGPVTTPSTLTVGALASLNGGVAVDGNATVSGNLSATGTISGATLTQDKGTWTPTLNVAGTLVSSVGTWTRYDDRVMIDFNIQTNSTETGADAVEVNNLPFATITQNTGTSYISLSATTDFPMTIITGSASNLAVLVKSDGSFLQRSEVFDGGVNRLTGNITYRIS